MITVGQTIARASRGRIIRALLGIALIAAALIAGQRYIYNFFAGPFPADIDALSAVSGPGELSRYYLSVEGDEVYKTGFYLEKKTDGVVTGRSNYYALALGDRLLLVETPATSPRTSFTGYLEQPRSDVQREVIADIESRDPSLRGAFLPMQLTDGDFKGLGWGLLLVIPALLGWMLWTLISALIWAGAPTLHPIARALGRFGDVRQAIGSIDAELATNHQRVGDLRLTPTWLIHQTRATLQVTRHEDIVWIYKKTITHRSYGVVTGRFHAAVICDRHGGEIAIQLKDEALVSQMLAAVASRAPWAIMGYQAEIERAWRRSRAAVVAGVDQRLQQLRTR
jgi:hypothetical protein